MKKKKIATIISLINIHLSGIPYDLYKEVKEGFFHAILISILELSNLPTRKEEHTNIGRIDLVIERPNKIYICECKLDQSAQIAIQQIQEKNYLNPYLQKDKELIALGINFSSEKRCISEWKAQLYSSEGKFLKEL